MKESLLQRVFQKVRPALFVLAFIAHVLMLVLWAGGVFVLFALAVKSSLEVVPRVLMAGTGAFMLWALWIQLPDFWSGWFGRRRRK